ncbi:MAG: methylisocitrate lyase [Chlamydiae bacterium]|nr:methylisocitrate lyase [Chlamydiota bacterium]MBI3265731.1 methylisocitrate lyase [Chlamydiota bacterium]
MEVSLKNLIKKEKILVVPGVFNAVTALIAQKAGFRALYLSGAGLANGVLGRPDIGLVTLTELCEQVRYVTDGVTLPLMVDVDTGFGGLENIARMVRELERAGASTLQMEDQVVSKKCGHLPGKELISSEEMVEKIRKIVETRQNKNFSIVARTDARSVEGLEEVIRRARAYLKAGADAVFPEALESREEFRQFAKKVKGLRMANMTEFGKTPYISVPEFQELGYHLVIFPMTAFRVMAKAVEDCFKILAKEGSQKRLLHKMQTRQELYDLIGYQDFGHDTH